jgi:hypothetical protein
MSIATVVLAVGGLGLGLGLGALSTGAGPAGAGVRAKPVDECTLLTPRQAAKIMGAKPYSAGAPDNGGCSWETDPSDRSNLAYVTVKVEPLKKYLGSYPNIRTFLDESTTVGIDELPGVGNEAFSTYSALSGPGSSDGITVRAGKQVLSVGFQATDRVENPSPEFAATVAIVKKMVAKVKQA